MEPILQDISKFFIAVLSVLNPLGVVPTFVGMTHKFTREEILNISRVCSIAVFLTCLIGVIVGDDILKFFGISIHSFKVGGGILIGMMSFQMLQGLSNKRSKLNRGEQESIKELGIVPLAIPLLAGPGVISTTIIYGKEISGIERWTGLVASLVVIALIVYVVLITSQKIATVMGRIGLNIMTRIMGLILLALSVEAITSGLKAIWNN